MFLLVYCLKLGFLDKDSEMESCLMKVDWKGLSGYREVRKAGMGSGKNWPTLWVQQMLLTIQWRLSNCVSKLRWEARSLNSHCCQLLGGGGERAYPRCHVAKSNCHWGRQLWAWPASIPRAGKGCIRSEDHRLSWSRKCPSQPNL